MRNNGVSSGQRTGAQPATGRKTEYETA